MVMGKLDYFMFIFAGVMSYQYGLVSPAGISILIFGLVLFFDVGVGMIVNPVDAIPYFPTVIMGVIMVGVLKKEA